MGKEEFLNNLRRALVGRLGQSEVEENIRYYEEYIDVRARSGQTVEEVLSALGDPRHIARSIIDADRAEETKKTSGFFGSLWEKLHAPETGTRMKGYAAVGVGAILSLALVYFILYILRWILPLALVCAGVYYLYRRLG